MPLEIQKERGGLTPFERMTIYSPDEAKETGMVAVGVMQLSQGSYAGREGRFQYLGSATESEIQKMGRDGGKITGPVINYDKPLGERGAVIRKVDFGKGRTVFISREGTSPLACGL